MKAPILSYDQIRILEEIDNKGTLGKHEVMDIENVSKKKLYQNLLDLESKKLIMNDGHHAYLSVIGPMLSSSLMTS